MTYSRDIPQNLPSPSIAVDSIRTNFFEYADVFDNNHSPINASTQGKHTNVILQERIVDPEVDSSFDSLYGKSVTSASSTSQECFVRIPQFLPNELPNDPMQLTFDQVNLAPQYQTFLPGGYVVYFDTIPSQVGAPINTQITLTPTPSEILCVIPNPTRIVGITGLISAPLQISVTIDAADKFTINAQAPFAPFITGDINWIAIARQ